eukprot:55589-Eustigmatos_ZCMA.PRE.1
MARVLQMHQANRVTDGDPRVGCLPAHLREDDPSGLLPGPLHSLSARRLGVHAALLAQQLTACTHRQTRRSGSHMKL